MRTKKKSVWETHKFNQSVIHNFEVSVVMSFYHKLEAFKKVLPKNAPYFQRNGIEVIIVMDEPTEQEGLIELIKEYPFINWKIIVNEKVHEPRNHASVLNVGIRHATKKYILISDPEMEFYTDVIFQLRNMLKYQPEHYATGTVAFIEEANIVSAETINMQSFTNYGSIMVEKRILEEIGAYDEQFKVWGGEDDNIRRRLDMAGIKQLQLPEAKSLHREKKLKLKESLSKSNDFDANEWERFFYPKTERVNENGWGQEFNKILYDWQDNQYAKELCQKYLDGFVEYEIKDRSVFRKRYKKLILCQAYNETEFIEGFLKDMAKYFDGIIMLDDGSSDHTWELARHEKLLLKVKKKRECFNDLENRNILLKLASFFKTDWFCFMDIDERFDERHVDFSAFENDMDVSVVSFNAVYLWDNEHTYKGGVPYTNQGILKVYRMFRPIGHGQILTCKNKLHFAACPYFDKELYANILFKDYGILKEKNRLKKYQMYIEEDKKQDLVSYDYLLDNSSELYSLKNIKLPIETEKKIFVANKNDQNILENQTN